jgi:hypothetical protein
MSSTRSSAKAAPCTVSAVKCFAFNHSLKLSPFFKNVNNNQRAIGSPVARENGVQILKHHQGNKDTRFMYTTSHRARAFVHVYMCQTSSHTIGPSDFTARTAQRTMGRDAYRIAACVAAACVAYAYLTHRNQRAASGRNAVNDDAQFAREQIKLKRELAALATEGNLAGDPTNGGALKALTREECGGTCERYAWTQDEREICVLIDCEASATSRDVRVEVTSSRLVVVVCGKTILDGELTRRVVADECLWEMERTVEGKKRITITLIKQKKTYAKFHWPSVCVGEPTVDVEKFGHPVVGVNNQDAHAMEAMMDDVRGMRREASARS